MDGEGGPDRTMSSSTNIHQTTNELSLQEKYLFKRGILAPGLHYEDVDGIRNPTILVSDLLEAWDGPAEIAAKAEFSAKDDTEGLRRYRNCPMRPLQGLKTNYGLTATGTQQFRMRWLGDLNYEIPGDEHATKGPELVSAPKCEASAGMSAIPFFAALPPEVWRDASCPVVVTEADTKSIAISQYGLYSVGMAGADAGLHDPKSENKTVMNSEAARFPWAGRTVYLMMDSGRLRNPSVAYGEARAAKTLKDAGATVWLAQLSESPKGIPSDPKTYDWGPDDFAAKILYRTYLRLAGIATTERGKDLAAKIAVKLVQLELVSLLASAVPGDPLDRIRAAPEEQREALLSDLPFLAALKFLSGVERERVTKEFGRGKVREIKAAEKDFTAKQREKSSKHDEPTGMAETLESVLGEYTFVMSPVGRLYAKIGNELVPAESTRFISKIAKAIHEKNRAYITREGIKNALLVAAGGDLQESEVPIRCARQSGKLYLDLGSDVVEMGPEGPKVLKESPVLFVRPSTAKPLPRPIFPSDFREANASLAKFRQLLGLTDELDWASCLAWMLSAVGTTGVYTALVVRGEKGSGKTTRALLLRQVFDPARPGLTGLPKDEENLAVLAQNTFVLGFDNLRYLSQSMSDALCRLATGDGLVKRTLYSDLDLTVLEATRPLIFTGIADVAKEPDLLDRSLIVTFGKIETRKTEEEIQAEFAAIHPEVLGALCYLGSRALTYPYQEVLPPGIRMVGPARFASAAYYPDMIQDAYNRTKDLGLDLAADDGLVAALVDLAVERGTWTGRAGTLLADLGDHVRGEDPKMRLPDWFPRSAKKLSSEIGKYAGELRGLGVTLEKETGGHGVSHGTYYTLMADPPEEEEKEDPLDGV